MKHNVHELLCSVSLELTGGKSLDVVVNASIRVAADEDDLRKKFFFLS
jgi:hypothetical protein